MPNREEDPVVIPGSRGGSTTTHPAFGQISASRVSGGTTLYGSDFLHHNFVEIRVKRSELHRELSRDWHHAIDELVTVRLSEAQWATFVSSMNVGEGVPCTLERVAGKRMPDIPLRTQEDAFKNELSKDLARANSAVEEAIKDIEGELGESISKKKRDVILARLHDLHRNLSDHMPFVAQSFEEHMEATVEKAKVEVNAYMYTAVQRAGLQALGVPTQVPLQLGAGEPDLSP